MLKREEKSRNFSKPIVFLAIFGITLGICVIILSISVTSGFQNEIRDKVVGFGSHIQIESQYSNISFESSPMIADQPFIEKLKQNPHVKNIQNYAYKPAIFQSKRKDLKNEDGTIIRDIEGVIFKGIDNNYYNSFFINHMNKGHFPSFLSNKPNDSIVISEYLAKKLRLDLHDKITTFFIKETGPKQRNLIVSGIYETGLEDFDKKIAFIDLDHIRKINGWGISTQIYLKEDCQNNMAIIEAKAIGGNGNIKYNWNNKEFTDINKILLYPIKDTIIKVIAADFDETSLLEKPTINYIPDTAWLKIKVINSGNPDCSYDNFEFSAINEYEKTYKNSCIEIQTISSNSTGSGKYYTGGIEILLNEYDDLFTSIKPIKKEISPEFRTSTIIEKHEEIFNWLNMLDINVYIIISLMIIVAIINMSAALLIIILEKTQMIGVLKSLGSTNWSIRKIFIYNGAYFITLGFILGNVLAILIIIIQNKFNIISLPQENYFVSKVPMHIPFIHFAIINIIAYLICFMALILPSYLITKISPIRAIKI